MSQEPKPTVTHSILLLVATGQRSVSPGLGPSLPVPIPRASGEQSSGPPSCTRLTLADLQGWAPALNPPTGALRAGLPGRGRGQHLSTNP